MEKSRVFTFLGKIGIAFFLFFTSAALTAYGQTKFEKTYGTANRNEYGRDVTILSSNAGYGVVGYVTKSQVNKDIYFLKLDTCGRSKISRTYGGSSDDMGYSISELSGGNMAIAGETSSYGSGLNDGYLMKISGATLATANGRAIGDTSLDIAQDFKHISTGYVVTGYTTNGTNGYDVLLTKFNSTLVAQWTYKIGGTHDDQAYAIQQCSNSDLIIAGGTKSYGVGNYDVYLIRTNANGIVLWAKAYGNTALDIGYNVKQTLDGGFIIVGKTRNSNPGGNSLDDVLLIKTSSTGVLQWSKSYGGTLDETGEDVVQLPDTGYVVTGYTKSFGSGGWDVYTFKVDKNGNTVWARTSGDTGEDKSYAIKKTADNGFVVAGHTNSFGAGVFDAYVLKTNSLGNTGCNDSSGINTYAPGDSTSSGYVQDTNLIVVNGAAVDTFLTIDSIRCSTCNPPKMGQLPSINESMVYPNPASDFLNINVWSDDESAIVEVYSALGLLVYHKIMAESNMEKVNISSWMPGLYFVRVSTNYIQQMTKVIISR
jgi:hypothetical protein